MKKILLSIFTVILLVACGEKKIELVSLTQKEKIVRSLPTNPKNFEDLTKRIKELKAEMQKGNKTAKAEYDEWYYGISRRRATASSQTYTYYERMLKEFN